MSDVTVLWVAMQVRTCHFDSVETITLAALVNLRCLRVGGARQERTHARPRRFGT